MLALTLPHDIPVEYSQEALVSSMRALRDPAIKPVVYPELDSTQEQARRLQAVPGAVIIAARQTHGHGRLGRAWLDTGNDGVALTYVARYGRPDRISIESAVAVATSVDACASVVGGGMDHPDIGIKWPNDIVVDGKKIAGILVEQSDDRAFIGVGVNVGQTHWPSDIDQSAISLLQLGLPVRRIVLIQSIIETLHQVASLDDDVVTRMYMRRDVLVGSTCTFRVGDRKVRGKVLHVDPMKGLAVLTKNEGEVWLPAATTTVLKD